MIYNTPEVQQLVMRIYTRVFSYLRNFMTWYTERSRTRFLQSFNNNIQQVLKEDLEEVRRNSTLLSRHIQLYVAEDVRFTRLISDDTNEDMKYLIDLTQSEAQKRRGFEITFAQMHALIQEHFYMSRMEMEKQRQQMLAEFHQTLRQTICGEAVNELLLHQVSLKSHYEKSILVPDKVTSMCANLTSAWTR